MKKIRKNNKFIYLISPNKIKTKDFYIKLNQVLSSKKVSFFQLRLKKETYKNKISIGKKIKK
ncbi:thiamine phosphate synthase, partial [Candidatus Pelagibacter sp.]|nr:thiamine phosphate synthase [Candidatus Pelagibacter sp.]